MPMAALAEGAFAMIYGWFKGGMITPVLGFTIVTYTVLSIF